MKRKNDTVDNNGEQQKVVKTEYEEKICGSCTFANNYLMEYCEICEAELPKPLFEAYPIATSSTVAQLDTSVTDGLIELIEFRVKHQAGIRNYRICSPTSHISQVQSIEGVHWSCGYRNIQILCTSLIQVPQYKQVLFNKDGDIPSIYGIQAWIEKAWRDGFDEVGAEDLAGPSLHLVGTSHWIGATECASLLRYFGINAIVVDFQKNYSTEGKSVDVNIQLFKWIKRYFEIYKQERSMHIPPLYFQHEGHSRTIIGYEQNNDKQSLLLFDPLSCGTKLKTNLQDNRFWQVSVKRGQHTFQDKSYQLVYVPPNAGLLTPEEREIRKLIVGEQPTVVIIAAITGI